MSRETLFSGHLETSMSFQVLDILLEGGTESPSRMRAPAHLGWGGGWDEGV